MKKVTFEEVYANAYVRESIAILVDNLVSQYPMLRPDREDIRQRLLLILDRQISRFDPKRSSIERFARITLESGVREVRRSYFGKRELALNKLVHHATASDEMENMEGVDDSAEQRETIEAVRYSVTLLSPIQQKICAMLAGGESLMGVCRELRIDFDTLKYKHIAAIREVMRENIF